MWQTSRPRRQKTTAVKSNGSKKRIAERDAKIDGLYAELRLEQKAKLEEVHKRHEVELELAEANVKKCHKRGCSDRQPPSDY